MTSNEGNQIPRNWQSSTLGEVCEKPEYGWTTSASETGLLKLLRTTDITKEILDWSRVPYCEKNPADVARFRLTRGDIVVSRAGSVGVSALIGDCPNAVFASYLIRFRPLRGLDEKYAFYFLHSPGYWRDIAANSAGIALQNVNARKLAAIAIPIAPELEQRRIVAEIEKQFTRLDAAVAALKRVQANLKRYRASVLKAACEGRLVPTEAELARREGRSYEPASELLKRILSDRRARWETAQLGKTKQSVYQEPTSPTTDCLPSLPEGWTWATLSQLSEIQGGIQKQPSRKPFKNTYPFLRVANVFRNRLDLTEVHDVELFKGELEKLRLQSGDLLIVEGNGSPSEIGRMAIWKGEVDNCVHQNHIIRARLHRFISPSYIAAYWNSIDGSSRILEVASSTSGLHTLSVSKVGRLPVPIPPAQEQFRAVAEIERRLSVVDELEIEAERGLKRSERLRQSILKRAFEGKLVPQNSNDEPASVLLERIRAERARRDETSNGNGRRKQKSRKKQLASV